MATAELGINIIARNQAKSALKGLKADVLGIQQSLGGVMKIAAGNFISSAAIGSVRALSGAVTGVVGAFNQASTASAEFNAQISSIAAVANASAEEIKKLDDLALNLGVDPKLKVSAVEAAEAIEMLARNGIKVPAILDGVARSTILLANSTGADFGTAADIATDAMAMFKIEAKDTMDAVNGITGVINNSKLSINDYALALGNGGKGAIAAGMSFDQFNQIFVATASNFKSGMTQGSAVTDFIMGIVPTTKPAIAAMKELGLITQDGKNQFFDLNGELRSNAEVAELLRSTVGKLNTEERIRNLQTIFGRDSLALINGMIDTTTESWEQYADALAKANAEESGAIRNDNLAGDMEIFRSTVESYSIKVGKQFDDMWRDIYQSANRVANQLGPIVVDISKRIADGIGGAIDRTRDYKAEFDQIIASFGDDKVSGIIAAFGSLTGGNISIDAEAKIIGIDWVNSVVGESVFTYDAESKIINVDWLGGWLQGASQGSVYTYDADAQVLKVDWISGITGEGASFVYDADAGIKKINWTNEYNNKFVYDADAKIIDVDFGIFSHTYDGKANINSTSVLWGAWTHNYDALAKVSQDSVIWGLWTHSYNATVDIGQTDVLWGAYSHEYSASANIDSTSVLWGAWTHSYDALASVTQTNVLWGLWTNTYNASAEVSQTSVLWGLWSTTYDVKAKVGSDSILWGLWTHTYNGAAEISAESVNWGNWSNTYSAAVDIVWPYIPPIFQWLFDTGGNVETPQPRTSARVSGSARPQTSNSGGGRRGFGNNAKGTDSWEGGWTWVGEEGPELLNLPRGARILSNPDSQKMIGQMAQGTGLPGGIFDGITQVFGFLSSAIGTLTTTQESVADAVSQNTEAVETAADMQAAAAIAAQSAAANNAGVMKATGEMIRVSAQQFAAAATGSGNFVMNGIGYFTDSFKDLMSSFGDNLESALQKVPGLFGTSEVTADQMKMAELGIPQNFADDYVRRLTDEVLNGVDWEGVDIGDAAKRAGIDPSLPQQMILEIFKEKWNDKSLFADTANLDLINADAVQQALMQQQAQSMGTANLLALFGITEDKATQAGVSAGQRVKAGVAQGMQSSGTDDASLAASLTSEVAPEQFAAVGATVASGIAAGVGEPENSSQIIDALASVFADFKSYGDVFNDASRSILNSIAQGFGDATDIDMTGKLAGALRKNLELDSSIQTLKNYGERVLEYVFQGYSDAAKEKNWPGATVGEAAAGADSSGTSATTATGNAIGTSNWRGGLTWVGETGPELVALPRGTGIYSNSDSMAMAGGGVNVTVNVASVSNDIDIQRMAYQIADIVQRRRR